MSSSSPPPFELPPPSGAPIGLGVDGILEGRVGDAAALRAAVHRLSGCGAGPFRLEITGGRFNVLPEETQVPAARFDENAQAGFLDALQQVVAAAAAGSVETTLRCKLVYQDQVAETLFVLKRDQLEPLTRRRPRSAGDAVPLGAEGPASFGVGRREILLIAPLVLVVGLLLAWRNGWIDRVLAARAEALQIDTGSFGDMLSMTAERSWGDYTVQLRRGPGFPSTPEQLAQRRDASPDLAGRAAVEVIGNGGELFVQLCGDDGEVLVSARTELRPLLVEADGVVELQLPGRIAGHGLRLSLTSGKKAK